MGRAACVCECTTVMTDDRVASRRAHQAGVARQCLEIRLGAHAAELAERDTHVAYLSSAMGLAENLLTAKQRWALPTTVMRHNRPRGIQSELA